MDFRLEEELFSYRMAVEQSVDGVAMTNMEGFVVFANDSWLRTHGLSAEEVLGRHLSIFHTPAQMLEEVEPFLAHLRDKGSFSGEVGHSRSDGTVFQTMMTTTMITDADANPVGYFALMRDITEEKRVKEHLANLAQIVDIAPAMIVVRDLEGRILYVNERALQMSGYSRDQFMSGRIGDFVVQGDPESLAKRAETLMKREQTEFELDLRRIDGSSIPIEATGKFIHWDGTPAILSVSTDISERRRLAAQRLENRKSMELLIAAGETLARSRDIDEILRVYVETSPQLTGMQTAAIYTLQEDHLFLAATDPPLPPEFPEHFRLAALEDHPHIRRVVENQEPLVIEDMSQAVLTPKEKEISEVRGLRTLVFIPLLGNRGVLGVLIVGSQEARRTVTNLQLGHCRTLGAQVAIALENAELHISLQERVAELQDKEQALRESEQQYRALFDRMQQPVSVYEVVQDEEGRVIDHILVARNEIFGKTFGIDGDTHIGKSIREINPQVAEEWIQKAGKVALTGEPFTLEYTSPRAQRHLHVMIYSPLQGQYAGIYTDFTELKQAEQKLLAANAELAALNTYSVEQSACRTYQALSETIARQLAEHCNAVMVAVSDFDPVKRVLAIKHIHADQGLLSLAVRLGGERITRVESPISDAAYDEIMTSAIAVKESLTEVTFGAVPKGIGGTLQRALGIECFLGMQLIGEGSLHGTAVIGLREKNLVPSKDFLVSYAQLASASVARMEAEEKVRYMSFHDQLTGLYNRHFLEEEMARMDTERQLPLSVIMGDVDGLKLVNDTYGHLRGDEMLRAATQCIKSCCRGEDIVSRWGGDEYVILLPQTGRKQAEELCRRISARCRGLTVGDVPVSVSLGFATKTSPDDDLVKVLHAAEDNMYKNKLAESRSTKSSVVSALLQALAEKSHETEAHTRRMEELALTVGTRIGLVDSELNRLRLLITLHDIGKINIPEELLTRSGPLTPEEWEIMRTHPQVGYRIAKATEHFAHVADDILAHHERWDGKGYPQELKGSAIPLLARITALVDAYEVMSNGRPYKAAMPRGDIVAELKRCSGTQFDPELVKVFLQVILSN